MSNNNNVINVNIDPHILLTADDRIVLGQFIENKEISLKELSNGLSLIAYGKISNILQKLCRRKLIIRVKVGVYKTYTPNHPKKDDFINLRDRLISEKRAAERTVWELNKRIEAANKTISDFDTLKEIMEW